MPSPNVSDPAQVARVALVLQLDAIVAACLAADVTASILTLDARRASVREAIDATTYSARQARRRLRRSDSDDPGGGS